jgi:hypothetical protein
MRRLLILGVGLAMGALVVAALITWQRGGDEATTAPPTAATPRTSSVAPPLYTVYLTDSAEQAAALPEQLAALTPTGSTSGLGEVIALAAGTPDEIAYARRYIATLDDQTNGSRVQLVDLRRAGHTAQGGEGSGCESGLAGDTFDGITC